MENIDCQHICDLMTPKPEKRRKFPRELSPIHDRPANDRATHYAIKSGPTWDGAENIH